jgi:hypothetical protein
LYGWSGPRTLEPISSVGVGREFSFMVQSFAFPDSNLISALWALGDPQNSCSGQNPAKTLAGLCAERKFRTKGLPRTTTPGRSSGSGSRP